MNINWKTFGHSQIKNLLAKQLEHQRVQGAYLFLGIPGVGKKTLALEFCEKILKTENLSTHPDFFLFDKGEEEISVESLREFSDKFFLSPVMGGYKTVVINNIHNLNTFSANSLLKTLEEPAKNTVIIMLSEKPPLPTILSRSQIFRFGRLSRLEVDNWLASYKNNIPANLISWGRGQVGFLYQAIKAGHAEILAEWQAERIEILSEKPGVRLRLIPKFSEMELGTMLEYVDFWTTLELDELAENPNNFFRLRLLQELRNKLAFNGFNKKLLFQQFLLELK